MVADTNAAAGYVSAGAAALEQARAEKKALKQSQRDKVKEFETEKQEKLVNNANNNAEAEAETTVDDLSDVEVDCEVIEDSLSDIKIATIGNVDAGKSTLVGVLTRSMLDDGRGKARSLVFNSGANGHEAQTGRTSAIALEIMGWRKDGEQIIDERANTTNAARIAAWQKITTTAVKSVSFLDLCGHEGYLKTTIFGLIGLCPDYAMIVINANAGFQKMTREHLGIALALKIPIFIVVTKIDIAPENVYQENMEFLVKMLKSKAVNRPALMMKTEEDINTATKPGAIEKVCPIFEISNVTGVGLPNLRGFMRKVPSRTLDCGLFKPVTEPAIFHLDHVFNVPGVGIVVSGLMKSGQVVPNKQLLLGPDKAGQFTPVRVKTIHYRKTNVDHVDSGQSAAFAITSMVKKEQLKKSSFRKGMVLIDPALNPKACWEFTAEIVILHHATTIKQGYEPVIHCGIIRQAAKVRHMTADLLRNGDQAVVTFCFKGHGEYLTPGGTILFREGRTKGIGRIKELVGFSRPSYLDQRKDSWSQDYTPSSGAQN